VQAQEKVMGDPTLVSFTDTVLLMLMALVALGLLAYFAVLLYRGFKTATNLKSTTQKVLFVVLLFVVATFSPYLLKL
jgi:cytochrome c oxidase assembly protein Cox11